ncbi:MAG: hypothetical protein ABR537_04410 [Gemmatimonadales bacterium]
MLLGTVVLTAVATGIVWWRAAWIAKHLLRSEAPKSIAVKSGGVYRVEVGRVRLSLLGRRITVDSIRLTTDSAVNARRSRPRTTLHLEFQRCAIGGMHMIPLILGRGLVAERFGCEGVSATADVPGRGPAPNLGGAEPPAPQGAFFTLQQDVRLPAFAPRVDIARVDFPHVELDVQLQRGHGGRARVELAHLQWTMSDLMIDPTDTVASARPLFSRSVALSAADFIAHPESGSAVRVAGMVASITDSTVELHGISWAPTLGDSAFFRARPYRRSLVKTHIARLAVRGLDVGGFLLGLGVRGRGVQVDSLRIDVSSDRRRPANPRPATRRTPQRWIAELGSSVRIDSVVVRGGEITYRELRARHLRPGVLTFARLSATAFNVRHVDGGRRVGASVTLRATAYLQNAGRLDAQFVAPLDASGFEMSFRGTLGPMPASSLNAFIAEAFAFRLAKGRVIEIPFAAIVRNGTAEGTITPRYHDLTLKVTGRGSGGILASGGVVGDAARGIATFVGNATEMHADNPDDGETTPREGKINHTFTPTETLPAFLWQSLREGLFAVVRK